MNDIKKKLHAACEEYVASRIETANHALQTIRESAEDETKSSAGDKYETGREMMQQDINRSQQQLEEAKRLQNQLSQLPLKNNSGVVDEGSLVLTGQGSFYISISAGLINMDGAAYYAVSAASPVAKALKGRKAGDSAEFNGRQYNITAVI